MASSTDIPQDQSPEPKELFRFGGFELNSRARELNKEGRRIRLQEQPFQILRMLLEHAGDVVTREQLRQRIWPASVYVDFDHGVNNAVARLRESLGDGAATPHFIETLPRVGYRFICPLEASPVVNAAAAAVAAAPAAPTPGPPAAAADPQRSRRAHIGWLALILLALAGTGFLVSQRWSGTGVSTSRGSSDAEAQRLYVMGMTMLRGRGIDRDPERAKQLFEEALARDPRFAAAHAGLALYHFHKIWPELTAVEENTRLGRLAAEHALALDPHSSEALLARADFAAWRARTRGDAAAYAQARDDYARAIELEPANSALYFNFGRAVVWDDPALSERMFARTVELDPLWDAALSFSALLLSQRGEPAAARTRLKNLSANSLISGAYLPTQVTLEHQSGHLDEAALLLQQPHSSVSGLEAWGLYLSLGDRAAAAAALEESPSSEVTAVLQQAMRASTDGNLEEAFAILDRHCTDFPLTHILDLPTARLALITGHAPRARALLEARLPDLVRGREPVKARNVIPAIDLASAYRESGDAAASRSLLARVATYLEGADVPHWPLFSYQRARAYALADEPEPALQQLTQAYSDGFRLVWALDIYPQPLLYIDSIDQDPAFARLRNNPRYREWRARIAEDNARQLAHLRSHADAATQAH